MKTLDSANLSEAERRAVEEVARRLKAELPVTRVILFGSKARGDAHPDSDIDLLVLASEPATPTLRDRISDRLFDVCLRVDLPLSELIVSEEEWSNGLIRQMLIHAEVEREGCEV